MFERLTYRKENGEVRTASGAMDIGDGLNREFEAGRSEEE